MATTIVSKLSGINTTVINKPPVDIFFDIEIIEGVVITQSGTQRLSTVNDSIYLIEIGSDFGQQYTLQIELTPGSGDLNSTNIINKSPLVAELLSGNRVSYLSNGVANLEIEVSNFIDLSVTRSLSLTFDEVMGATTISLSTYVPNSVRADVTQAVDDNIVNLDVEDGLNIFDTQNHSLCSYTRNISCWAYEYDLTCISPYNTDAGTRKAGTLVTPRHIIFAAHYEIANNATVRFVRTDNTVVDRVMTHKQRHPSYSPYFPDLTIGVLDSDVPSDIKFCRVLPDNWENYFPTGINRMPCLTLDQEEKALITDGNVIFTTYTSFLSPESNTKRREFYELKISGDSGNPAFLIINDELVLLTVWTFGGAGRGTSITYYKSDINQMIKDVDIAAGISTGYTLSEISLSAYTDFS